MTEAPLGGMITADYMALQAAERPDAAALINDGRAISYAEFVSDVGRFVAALREFELPRGAAVAVGCDDFYIHWLLLLALERLNVATASYLSGEGPRECQALLAGVDFVLSEADFPTHGARRHSTISPAWVREALAREPEDGQPRLERAPSDPMRILRSSGTTGRPKRFMVTRHMYELRLARLREPLPFTRTSRYLLAMPFAVDHVYRCATICLRAGGTVVAEQFAGAGGAARAIAARGITHVSLQPLILKQILDDLPPDFAKPAELAIAGFGSAMSDELSGRALRLLATEVSDFFGCNEVGGVSCRHATSRDDFCLVWPGIEVEAVDEAGQPVPSGEPGRLRIRSESMVAGYLDDPETTRRMFKDGWFYPGDVAILDGPRRLKVLGRGDELLNVSGAKLAPSDLEALVMEHAAVGDVGVCGSTNREGIEEVYVGVANVRQDPQELLARITHAFRIRQLGSFHVVILPAIPRNAAGKIHRDALKEAVAAALRRERS